MQLKRRGTEINTERFKRESFEHLKAMKTAEGIAMNNGALFAIGYKG